ncbi:ROK family protein [Vibrio aestuarianus]|uniref:ROK family protein n=1 Tax=Vibrio aestuarianus TaxID=28171 RepID=UPI00237CB167|nr:ROK family protein [Vibrio aestuarianus]MDE1262832.1 ROK family protein [Vibrio aestuarianus]MDE1295031.1 ROK family protein [Vibrio aestuarianus]
MLIGLDIGGTKIEGVLLESNTLNLIERIRMETPKTNYQDFLERVEHVIDSLSKDKKALSIGIGCCGSVDEQTGLMKGANIQYLNGEAFLLDLEKIYPVPIEISNDANCLAISEFKTGAAKTAKSSCVAIIIGTGCGSGIIANGGIIEGLNGLGGEIGHNPLPHYSEDKDGKAEQCYCGSANCIESFVSGTGFERVYALKHTPLKAVDIFINAKNGDENAMAHIELYCDQLARVIGSIVNVIDPEVFILGGGVSNQDIIYPILQGKLKKYTFSKSIRTKIIKAKHGDSSGVIGAAMLPLIKKTIKQSIK